MKKFTTLLIVLVIIGVGAGGKFFRSPRGTITTSPETHLGPAVESIKTSHQVVTKAETEHGLAQSEFQDILDQKFKTLPTIGDLQQLTAEDVHYTPEVIKEAGGVIGLIQDEAEKDPAKRVPAMHFFKRCAEDQEMVPAIRAVCLSKILKLIPTWQIPVPLSDELISQEITDLASKLP
ncbi:MAG: hypothetical protein NDI69_12900 [Bacteriovoracaceae bacterium]|nr:hypothetical protein [Bacteriovoracaceae bacterium]